MDLLQAYGHQYAARNAEVLTVRASAKEFGDDAHVTDEIHEAKFFGSTMVELMLVNILNSYMRTS